MVTTKLAVALLFLFVQGISSIGVLGDDFVRTSGGRFVLNGRSFYVNGFNAYWLMIVASDPSQRYKVSNAFREASSHGLTVARTWAFHDAGYMPLQNAPGSYNEQVFQALDFAVAEAKKFRIKLIMTLGNNYNSFGGKQQYVNWARNRGQYLSSDDDFFRNNLVKSFFKNHIKTVLSRYNRFTGIHYKNDPTIMAWELMNEPRCTSDPSGRTIQAWLMEMSMFVKSIDRNHLLEAGLEGFYGHSSPHRMRINPSIEIGTDFIANNRIPYLDFATIHAYPDEWLSSSSAQLQSKFMNTWLATHIRDAQFALRKPLLVTEFGSSRKHSGFNPNLRTQLFNVVFYRVYMSARQGGAAAGSLFWQLTTGGMDKLSDGYEIFLGDHSSTSAAIALQSRRLRLLRG